MARHLIAPFVRIRSVFLVAAFASLAACGGGGDGGGEAPISYTGATNPAAIESTNATTLTLASYEMGSAGAGAMGTVQSGPYTSPQARSVMIANITSSAVKKSGATTTAIGIASESLGGPCGGSVTVTVTSQSGTTAVGAIAFNNYCEQGVTIAGNATFSGDFSSDPFTWLELLMNLNVRDNASGTVYRVENYGIGLVDTGSGFSVVIATGSRFYHPAYGYVLVEAVNQPLVIGYNDNWPTSGELLVDEDGGAQSAKLVIPGTGGDYDLYFDANGDGAYAAGELTTDQWPY